MLFKNGQTPAHASGMKTTKLRLKTNPSNLCKSLPFVRGSGVLILSQRDLLDLAKAPTAMQAGRFVPPTPEEMDRLIPDYAFQALIGQGGMGPV